MTQFRSRRVDVHRLTISGLPEGIGYGDVLKDARETFDSLGDAVLKGSGHRSYAVHTVQVQDGVFRVLFLSYRTGYRPDILDTSDFTITPNPLPETQTGVDWTHAVGGWKGDRYVLLVERVGMGVYESVVERYLQWMLDRSGLHPAGGDNAPVVSVQPEPGEEFASKVEALDRIRAATIRRVRPNPGWRDLDMELAEQAEESDAKNADLTMRARNRQSLSRRAGIVAAILSKARDNDLDYARVEGKRGGVDEVVDTRQVRKQEWVSLELDEQGQVKHTDAWQKLTTVYRELD